MYKQALFALVAGAALVPALSAAPAEAATIVISTGNPVPPPPARVIVVRHAPPPPPARVVVVRHEEPRHYRHHEEVRYAPVIYTHDNGRHEGWRR